MPGHHRCIATINRHASSVGHQIENRRGQLSLFLRGSKERRRSEIQFSQAGRTLRHALNIFWLKGKKNKRMAERNLFDDEHMSLFVCP